MWSLFAVSSPRKVGGNTKIRPFLYLFRVRPARTMSRTRTRRFAICTACTEESSTCTREEIIGQKHESDSIDEASNMALSAHRARLSLTLCLCELETTLSCSRSPKITSFMSCICRVYSYTIYVFSTSQICTQNKCERKRKVALTLFKNTAYFC